jgi:DNA-binding CsgD family transcriptional regulator
VAAPLPLTGRIAQSFLRRIAPLPEVTQRLLLLAATEPVGDPALLWRAAGRLGISADAAAPAEADRLLTVASRVTFRHPLVRSAVYQAAPIADRRRAHHALAEATDPGTDPDRRAWHRAQAAAEPDEDIAAELERSATRAQARGGVAAAAAFLERSAALTPGQPARAARALAAAQAKSQAGAFDAALRLLAAAEAGPLDEVQCAQADLLRGQVAFASSRGSDAPPLLLTAARQFEPLSARMARDTYLDAISAALFAGHLASGVGVREVAEAARRGPPSPRPPRPPDLLLDGLAVVITDGWAAGAPLVNRAVSAFRSADVSREEGLRWLWLACHAAGLAWDYEGWDVLSARQVKLGLEAGALIALPIALNTRVGVHLFAGEFAAAALLVTEVESVTEATGSSIAPYGALALAALRGQETEAAVMIEAGTKDVQRRGEGAGLNFVWWATAVLCNGLGRYGEALTAAHQATEDSNVQMFSNWALSEFIEAVTRTGAPQRAAGALRRLSETTCASGSDWALGVEARSRALVSEGETAESLYRDAIERFGRTRLRMELGRAHLVYGEWLRRENRRTDAREQLRTAHQILAPMRADGFAQRATRELRATGERVRTRRTEAPAQLTARESQIAQLAGDGLSNPDIAAELFMSPRTVEYHLHKVFTKLAINSRNQLHVVLDAHLKEEPRHTT